MPGGPTFFANDSRSKSSTGYEGSMPKIASNAVFKSKQPRIGYHHDLEKKIRDTHTNMNEGLDSYSRDQYSTI